MIIGLIFGGKSPEHNVSVETALTFSQWIDYSKYEVLPVFITKQGQWLQGEKRRRPLNNQDVLKIVEHKNALTKLTCDIAVPLLHGMNGEDGTIQGVFEMLDIAYTGNGVAASAISIDKALTKKMLESHGIPQVPYVILKEEEWIRAQKEKEEEITNQLQFPLFIKPAKLGSSIGITKVYKEEQLINAINEGFLYDDTLMIENGLNIREINIAVLETSSTIITSLPGETVTENEYYDYDAKYNDQSETIKKIASLDLKIEQSLQMLAKKIFKAVNGSGLMRVDFFLTEDGAIYLNEVNTLPSMGGDSMYPFMLEESGVKKEEIVEHLITVGLKRYEAKKRKKLDYESLK